MSSFTESEPTDKDGAVIGEATNRPRNGDAPALLTEEALTRLEEGLRAARTADRPIVSTQIEAISESPPLAPSADQPGSGTDEAIQSPSRRRRKVGLLLCALLPIIGAAALGVSLKPWTGRSTDAAPANIEARGRTGPVVPNKGEPDQPNTDAAKSSAAAQSLPPDNGEPGQPNAVKTSAAPSPPQDNGEPGQPISNAVKSSAAEPPLAPVSRHPPMNNRSTHKSFRRRRPSRPR